MQQGQKEGGHILTALDSLTAGQRDCLRLVAQHMTSKEIARLLGVSKDTVDQRIAGAVRKLNVNSRAEAARLLIAHQQYDPIVCHPMDMEMNAFSSSLAGLDNDAQELTSNRLSSTVGAVSMDFPPKVSWTESLPVAIRRGQHNTLSWQARLLWMLAIPIGIGLLALQLTAVLDGLSRLYE